MILQTALCIMTIFKLLLTSIVSLYRKTGEQLQLYWDTLKCDESEKKLAIDAMEGLSRDQRISKYPILTQQRTVGWVDAAGRRTVFGVPTMLTIMLGIKSAGCLWDGLFVAAWLDFLGGFNRFMRSIAKDSFSAREADNAAVVQKCFIKEMRQKWVKFYSYLPCGIHQGNLAISGLVKCFLAAHVAALYVFVQWLKMGNSWLRVLLCIDTLLEASFRVEHSPPCPSFL